MDANIAMCRLREAKQNAFDEACCAFATNHNMAGLARKMDMGETILRNKLNPEQPHKLYAIELAWLCYHSGDYSIHNVLYSNLGTVTVALPQESEQKNFIERTLLNNALSGELSGDAMQMCTAERLPRSTKNKTLAKAHAALGNLVLMISDLENRTTGLQPLMQMGTDFLANGAPLPGLA
ncbi:phage regulatory CII family protein [Vibrio parahaemolyticus]|uniref:phage regulatory CII family protein n=1 Tax=Vibrio parahaemolyticus TaxID=670 RepID=UPI0007A091B7|nr:phage regulatory CII family protein [Vibrio parahaemolyticus]KYZ12601.1 transcriptional regulator [Vibrio parahaemolyticus]MBM5287185.1 phage regulatory CII family protein [Vibrio parahaemolyticus]MCF9117417.1 phage regulatory CII family protein [Vibrio parahaemolyticus]MDF5166816.1 phage regulatory CII family protein [Vibrio parahaemolyticus]